ncbi:MAG: alanine racemase [bacterium]
MDFYRPTWAEIDLGAVSHNIVQIRKKLQCDAGILAMVKADGYGHGAIEVARTLVEAEYEGKPCVSMLGVALIEEGIQLRQAGFKNIPVLILGSIYPMENFEHVVKFDLTPTICSLESAQALGKIAHNAGKKVNIHVEVDTGMGRIGVSSSTSNALVEKISKVDSLNIEGIYTHFPAADTEPDFTETQIMEFKKILEDLDKAGVEVPLRHMANSAALIKYKGTYFNIVRPGLAIYGLLPFPSTLKYIDLRPVFSLKSRIVYLKKVPIRTSISYGRTFITKRDSLIATIPVGYGDGYSRLLSNKGEVLIRGKRVPVVGRVCMDMFMVDVTDIPKANVGDEVVLAGTQGNESITIEEIADKTGTISYEVVCQVSKRVPRVYMKG